MIALDTNVLVRVITLDDPQQATQAVELMESDRLWLSKTVLLELEWVLRYSYQLSVETIANALRSLLGNRRIEIEDRTAVVRALRLFSTGLDFADALHLASSGPADRFATFDRQLAGAAGTLATPLEVKLLG